MQNLPSTQVVVVLAEDWDSPRAKLALFERESLHDSWKRAMDFVPCLLGKNGLGWGLGIHTNPKEGKWKKEGDMKAPAGVFSIRASFGEMPLETLRALQMEYLQTHGFMEYVDDPQSIHYNKCVDVREIAHPDWSSSEKMLREDDLYKLGLIIAHNEDPIIAGNGSCIFMHTWRNQSSGSAGCTVLDFDVLRSLVFRLNKKRSPLLVQGTSDALQLIGRGFLLPEV